ncbi:hypothetical protein [Roseibium sp.]|uniref:hypothetical protein n=1 Tax=Roseibium sp. TaxID=1936156 RepID=UPI003B511A97
MNGMDAMIKSWHDGVAAFACNDTSVPVIAGLDPLLSGLTRIGNSEVVTGQGSCHSG